MISIINPREKAVDLFVRFRTLANDDTIEKRNRTAKNICIELIDNMIWTLDHDIDNDELDIANLQYWNEVKNEINVIYHTDAI